MKFTRAFTLIETLVAIAILMIAVAGPLVIANKALTSALYARNQSTASYLAQEEMEIVKNTRDNALKNNTPPAQWLDNLGCPANAHCDISVDDPGGGFPPKTTCGNGCQLFLGSKGYSHDSSGSKTLFSRYFTLTRVDDNDYQVSVLVSWNEGTVPSTANLHSELVNALP